MDDHSERFVKLGRWVHGQKCKSLSTWSHELCGDSAEYSIQWISIWNPLLVSLSPGFFSLPIYRHGLKHPPSLPHSLWFHPPIAHFLVLHKILSTSTFSSGNWTDHTTDNFCGAIHGFVFIALWGSWDSGERLRERDKGGVPEAGESVPSGCCSDEPEGDFS